MSSNLSDRKTAAHRKLVMDSIVQQAMTVPDWQACAADLMEANRFTVEEIQRKVTLRAFRMTLGPSLTVLAASTVIEGYLTLYEPRWAEPAWLILTTNGVVLCLIAYLIVLRCLHAGRRYLPEVPVITSVALIMGLTVFFSGYICDGFWFKMLFRPVFDRGYEWAAFVLQGLSIFGTALQLSKPLAPKANNARIAPKSGHRFVK